MRYTLSQQTVLAVYVVVKDDTGTLTISLRLVIRFFALLWQISRKVNTVKNEIVMLTRDIREAVIFTAKVFSICLSSLAYGLGMIR